MVESFLENSTRALDKEFSGSSIFLFLYTKVNQLLMIKFDFRSHAPSSDLIIIFFKHVLETFFGDI